MITPTAIAQYKRSETNKETYILESGDAREFCRVYPTSEHSRASYTGKVYITFGGYGGVNTSKLTKCVNRFGKDARVLGAWKFDNSGHKLGRESLSSLAGGAIVHGHTCYYGDTKPHGNSAVLVEVSADANTLTLYLFEGKAGLMASLYDEWCAGRLMLQAA